MKGTMMMTGYDYINNDDDLVDGDDTEDDTLGWWLRGQSSNLAGWVPGLVSSSWVTMVKPGSNLCGLTPQLF